MFFLDLVGYPRHALKNYKAFYLFNESNAPRGILTIRHPMKKGKKETTRTKIKSGDKDEK